MPLSEKEYLQVNQALFSLAHAYESRLSREPKHLEVDLSIAERAVVMVLGQFEPTNARRLAKLMDLNAGTISQYVQRLVEKDLIAKEQDTQDRRNWWLSLTDAGREAFRETIADTVVHTRDFLAVLDESEQRVLQGLLLRVSRSLGFDWQ